MKLSYYADTDSLYIDNASGKVELQQLVLCGWPFRVRIVVA